MHADHIEKLLAQRHSEDIFVPQCKNGSTHYNSRLRILDAWVMAKSWVHPKYTAYEIKVSRQDFLRDDKWREALPLCNEFYWVAPKGIIDPAEVAPECGLMIAPKNGNRLLTKKKAVYREIEAPLKLLHYVLMCRTNIKNEVRTESKAAYWRAWLTEKNENRALGKKVSNTLRRIVQEQITDVKHENDNLRSTMQRFEEAESILRELGLVGVGESPRGQYSRVHLSRWRMREEIQKALVPLPGNIVDLLMETGVALRECKAFIGSEVG